MNKELLLKLKHYVDNNLVAEKRVHVECERIFEQLLKPRDNATD